MKLYLMRHGDYVMDPAQQLDVLTEQGKAEIAQMMSIVKPLNIHVANIFHSTKHRAEQTAHLLSQSIKTDALPTLRSGLNPNDDIHLIAAEMGVWEGDVVLVGHLPFMSRLTSQLLLGNPDKDIVFFSTGTVVCLERIESERWMMYWMLTPELTLDG